MAARAAETTSPAAIDHRKNPAVLASQRPAAHAGQQVEPLSFFISFEPTHQGNLHRQSQRQTARGPAGARLRTSNIPVPQPNPRTKGNEDCRLTSAASERKDGGYRARLAGWNPDFSPPFSVVITCDGHGSTEIRVRTRLRESRLAGLKPGDSAARKLLRQGMSAPRVSGGADVRSRPAARSPSMLILDACGLAKEDHSDSRFNQE